MNMKNKVHTNIERLHQIIRHPHISEKATILGDQNKQFIFKVLQDANKNEIKSAVEVLFNVKVDAVRTCTVKPKTRQFKQRTGSRKGWKKAYVSLKEGHDIDFTGTKGVD